MRKPTPPRMLTRTRFGKNGQEWVSYYYDGRNEAGKRIEIPLGSDLNEAKRKWAELDKKEFPAEFGMMKYVFDRYQREIIPTKAPRTQKDNLAYLGWLRKAFDNAPIDSIMPMNIAQYRDGRGKKAPVRANRELSLFSHVWNKAREWGYTAKENPCTGVSKNKETPSDYYCEDDVWSAVIKHACRELRQAMELAYYSGQRPADVLKMKFSDARNGILEVKQNKTKAKLRIALLDKKGKLNPLGNLIEEIKADRKAVQSFFLLSDSNGLHLTYRMLINRFNSARQSAAIESLENGNADLALRIKAFKFKEIRPKSASDLELADASKLLGHTEQEITKKVYRRKGDLANPVIKPIK